DGLIEAVSVRDSRAFAVGVQWHPEWRFAESPLSMAIFAAFGAAVRSHHRARTAKTTT
ncbi:MAG: gamma-glutamyl-gamma-aminobutyrate hydrolase family protein, partial [Pseudomonadales bacterium]